MSKAQHELPILVTGAAGRIGSVGRSVTELLLARGFRVRAQVRVDDERATRLRALGAEVVVGDLLDLTIFSTGLFDDADADMVRWRSARRLAALTVGSGRVSHLRLFRPWHALHISSEAPQSHRL